jgi:hypothetical protein
MFWRDKDFNLKDITFDACILMSKHGFDLCDDYLPEEEGNILKGCKMLAKAIGTVDGWKAYASNRNPSIVLFYKLKTDKFEYYYNFDERLKRKIDAKIVRAVEKEVMMTKS